MTREAYGWRSIIVVCKIGSALRVWTISVVEEVDTASLADTFEVIEADDAIGIITSRLSLLDIVVSLIDVSSGVGVLVLVLVSIVHYFLIQNVLRTSYKLDQYSTIMDFPAHQLKSLLDMEVILHQKIRVLPLYSWEA